MRPSETKSKAEDVPRSNTGGLRQQQQKPSSKTRLSIVPARALDDPRLSDAERCVLMLLGCYVNTDNGSCWPSIAELASRRGVSERVIRAALRKLRECGYIARKQRKQAVAITTVLFDAKTGSADSGLGSKTGSGASIKTGSRDSAGTSQEERLSRESYTDSESVNHTPEHYTGDPPPDGGAPDDRTGHVSRYAFQGKVVRLKRADFDRWRDNYGFGEAGLRALLTQRDDWLASPEATDDHRKRWFISTSNWLATKVREPHAGNSDGKQHHPNAPRRSARDILRSRHGLDTSAEAGFGDGVGATLDLGRAYYSEVR